MHRFRFTYRTAAGSIRSNIIIDAPDKESAIADFETDYPDLNWKVITKLTKVLF